VGLLFDKINKVITIEDTTDEITIQNLLNAVRQWEDELSSMDIGQVASAAGKEPLGGGVVVGITLTLLDNWRLAFEARDGPTYVQCKVSGGNLVGTHPDGVIYPTAFTQVVMTASSSATLQELGAIQYSSFGGGVTLDVVNGEAGAAFPIGTKETPVNNLTDAVTIANSRGFDTLFISNSMTLDSGTDIRSFILVGKSAVNTHVMIDPSAVCDHIGIENCNISGTLDGGTEIRHCSVGDLTYVNGHIHESGLYGTIILGGNKSALIDDCHTADQDKPPVIDMGGSGQDLSMFNYSGTVAVSNLSSDSEEISIGVDAGEIILEDTITAGTIVISGNGMLTDNSTGTADVNTDGLMSKQTITEISWDAVYIDSANGSSGTAFPVGTATTPVDNIISAVTIANTHKIKTFKIRGPVDLPQTFEGWTFVGVGSIYSDSVNLNGQNVDKCRFELLTVSGVLTTTYTNFTRCSVLNVSGLSGLLIDSALQGNITMGGPGSILTGQNIGVYGNTPGAPAIVDMVGAGRIFQASMDGALQFSNVGPGSYVEIGLKNGIVILDPTCTGGTASFTGVGNLINYSTTTVLNTLLTESSITNSVWEGFTVGHTTSGTYGKLVNDINSKTNDIETYMVRSLGLAQENYYLDQTNYTTYQGIKLLTSGRLRTYSVSGSVGTDSDVIATYNIVSSWTGDELNTYKVTKV
jgi:hypothetical protein